MLLSTLGLCSASQIVDVQFRVVLTRTEHTAEDALFYRAYDLRLTRERALSLQRSWTVMHPIDEQSPLFGMTPETMLEQEVELRAMVVGLDDTWMQTVHASHGYYAPDIVWGMRHADVLSEDPSGSVLMDLRKFHDLEPTVPTERFPYPR